LLSLVEVLPAAPLTESMFLSAADNMRAAPLAESLISFSCGRLARRAAYWIARFFLPPTTHPPCRLLNRSFLSPADDTPAAPLTESLVSSSRRRHARRAAYWIARFFLPPTTRPPRRLMNRSFLALADV
jgi:hypothetical protein